MCNMQNSSTFVDYVQRISAVSQTSMTILAGPDDCAPPHPSATSSNMVGYGSQWGDSGGSCITNAQARTAGHPLNPADGSGRFPHLDGTQGETYTNALNLSAWWSQFTSQNGCSGF